MIKEKIGFNFKARGIEVCRAHNRLIAGMRREQNRRSDLSSPTYAPITPMPPSPCGPGNRQQRPIPPLPPWIAEGVSLASRILSWTASLNRNLEDLFSKGCNNTNATGSLDQPNSKIPAFDCTGGLLIIRMFEFRVSSITAQDAVLPIQCDNLKTLSVLEAQPLM